MGNTRSSRCELVALGMPQRERDLHLAVMGNDKSLVQQIVAQGVDLDYPWSNPAIPSIKDSTTPLLAAVSLNHVEISMVCVQNLSEVTSPLLQTRILFCQRTPLSKITFFCFSQMLLQYGAAVNRTDRNGCTPLYKAAYHGRPVLVDMLVKAGEHFVYFPHCWGRVGDGQTKKYE
jgi:ankyrin repeat protein